MSLFFRRYVLKNLSEKCAVCSLLSSGLLKKNSTVLCASILKANGKNWKGSQVFIVSLLQFVKHVKE